MRKLFLTACLVAGCAGGGGTAGFMPYPPAADEIQVLSPTVTIPSGANSTLCSYINVPIAAETDVIASRGIQSPGGHHSIVYVANKPHAVDTHECNEDDMLGVRFIAGIGAEGATSLSVLPDGIAFRIPANAQIMIQTHWINATNSTLQGQAAINLKTATPSSARVPADLFAVADISFNVPAGKIGTSSSSCTLKEDMNFFYLGGHEHQWGTHFRADHVAIDGTATTLYEKDWQVEYEFNPPVNTYPKTAPLSIKQGESLKVECTWDNTSGAQPLTFPADMCVAFAFYFPGHGEIDCVDGQWPN
ncbi:MAG TPA: hypothetical protein VFF06_03135 [Polyangia bacterium]|nr:hypothetical protein [Polyangia bacterium]